MHDYGLHTSYAMLLNGNPRNITREHGITILNHAIENTVANTITATYAWHTMGGFGVILSDIQQLSCILIGYIFYGLVYKKEIHRDETKNPNRSH